MKSKEDIINNWLPRYTGNKLYEFGKYILLTNFNEYLKLFCEITNSEVVDWDRPIPAANGNGIKTEESDRQVSEKFARDHLRIGIDSMLELLNNGESVKHLKFD